MPHTLQTISAIHQSRFMQRRVNRRQRSKIRSVPDAHQQQEAIVHLNDRLADVTSLEQPGGAPNAYLRYADDAFALDFSLPATLNPTASTPAVLRLTVMDLAGMLLDVNPATAVTWRDGHWTAYDGESGVEDGAGGRRGGADRPSRGAP